MNQTLVVALLVAVVILLFVNMVLAAMAANDARKSAADCREGCHKYATISAVVSGLAFLSMVIIFVTMGYSGAKKYRNVGINSPMEMSSLHEL